MGDWIVEAERGGDFGLFYTYATGYETAEKAKMAAARALKSKLHARRARVVFDGDGPTVIYETTFRPGERAKWTEHPGNMKPNDEAHRRDAAGGPSGGADCSAAT